jgi:hypothetical protein
MAGCQLFDGVSSAHKFLPAILFACRRSHVAGKLAGVNDCGSADWKLKVAENSVFMRWVPSQ